jgi:predicted lipid-binding transport protein (Tim44 family)
MPNGFDEEEFLAGAVLAFARINEAVDRLDTLTLQDFAAPEIVNAVKVRINADEARVESEVDRVSGRVLEHAAPGPDNSLETVTVHLEGRRRTKAGATRTLRSVWRFERNTNDPEPRWILVSMRPVEA